MYYVISRKISLKILLIVVVQITMLIILLFVFSFQIILLHDFTQTFIAINLYSLLY